MAKTKTIEVYITSLRITAEDDWLKDWIDRFKAEVRFSPQFLYLMGKPEPLLDWMKHRNLPSGYISLDLMHVLRSLIEEGQKEPIKIYKDFRINTGHKRAACLLFLGKKTIKAEIVPDDYKL